MKIQRKIIEDITKIVLRQLNLDGVIDGNKYQGKDFDKLINKIILL